MPRSTRDGDRAAEAAASLHEKRHERHARARQQSVSTDRTPKRESRRLSGVSQRRTVDKHRRPGRPQKSHHSTDERPDGADGPREIEQIHDCTGVSAKRAP
jgi:hypothetical protein